MRTRLIAAIFLTLAATLLLAAPALAAYPVDYEPGVAYVHPWGDPAYWEEILWEEVEDPDTGELYSDWVLNMWDTDTVPQWDGTSVYKAIPADYDIELVAWMMSIPRGQMATMPGTLLLEFSLADQEEPGDVLLAMTAKQARNYWGKAFGPDGWAMPTINKEMAQMWIIVWTYDLGSLPPGIYGGPATYVFRHNLIDMTVWDDPPPDPYPRTPTHALVKGTYPCPYSFTVKETVGR